MLDSFSTPAQMRNEADPMGAEYSIRKVTHLAEFQGLKTIWDNLADEQGPYSPFLCFDWFKIWLEHFLGRHQLLILLLYKGTELVTIAPFLIKKETVKGINVRKIDLIGNAYSPFRYFMLREVKDEEKVKSLSFILQFMSRSYRDWDILDFNSIPEEKDCFDVLKRAVQQEGMRYTDFVCYGDWYLDGIECSGDGYFKSLPDKIRKDISYCKRRLEKMGKYEFKLIRNGDGIDHYMDLYYQVYSRSWQEKESIGPNFHRDLAKMAVEKSWLRLGFLFFNNLPIASQFWILYRETAFILKTVYDQNYKKYSPGKILTSEIAKFLIDNDKVKTIDYVQGDEAYKQDWTPKRRERKGVTVFNENTRGQYLALLSNKILPIVNKNPILSKVKKLIKTTAHKF